jgi:excisionase family DNA binding protein
MEGYVIITEKEDLRQIIREVFAELTQVGQKDSVGSKYLDIDNLLDFLRQNNCHISKSQIYKLTRSKNIPYRKIGKNLLFNKEEILNWLHDGR